MRRILLILLAVSFPLLCNAGVAKALSIDIKGLACPFCLNALTTNLLNVPGVKEVRMSADNHKVLVVMQQGKIPDTAQIEKTIQESGYTPVDVKSVTPAEGSTMHKEIKSQPCSTCHAK